MIEDTDSFGWCDEVSPGRGRRNVVAVDCDDRICRKTEFVGLWDGLLVFEQGVSPVCFRRVKESEYCSLPRCADVPEFPCASGMGDGALVIDANISTSVMHGEERNPIPNQFQSNINIHLFSMMIGRYRLGGLGYAQCGRNGG